jgi:hypothetical protein
MIADFDSKHEGNLPKSRCRRGGRIADEWAQAGSIWSENIG